jgi:FkbM family methyltransferase
LLKIRPVEFAAVLKKLFGIERREVRIGKFTLWIDPATAFGNQLLSGDGYEPALAEVLSRELRAGDVFMDLGSNEGYFALLASEIVGPSGHVFAIEPQLRLWPIIIQNLALNDKSNWTLMPYAIGPERATIDLWLFPDLNSGATALMGSLRRRFFRRQKAQVLPLAEVIRRYQIDTVSVLKIDIEGYELNALSSLGDLLAKGVVRKIIVELHPAQLALLKQAPRDVEDLLRRSGYRCRTAAGAINIWEQSPEE